MVKSPLVVGVRQLLAPNRSTQTVAKTMDDLGLNTGNMMFTESLVRVVKNAHWGSFILSEEELSGKDAIIIAAANWVNEYSDFQWLYEALKDTKVPVYLVGVGAQATISKEIPKVKSGTLSLLKLVSERSKSIAARGNFSCEVLAHYGIHNSVATGCPSMLLVGPQGPKITAQEKFNTVDCCLHATRHLYQNADEFQAYLYRQAMLQDLDLILQSELADMYFALARTNNVEIMARATEVVTSVYATDSVEMISRFLSRRGRVFFTFDEWIAFMKGKRFCLGTRIHGTIASLIAGTQATLIVHDSRTLEMAEAMQIPFVLSSDIDRSKKLNLSDFTFPEQCESFVDHFSNYYSRFLRFFDDNNIAVEPSFRGTQGLVQSSN